MTSEPRRSDVAAASADALLKLEDFLPYRLTVLASLVSEALSRIYADRYGIDIPEWRILVTLGQFGSMTAKAVGAHAQMHKTKVSRAVAGLEQRKLIARRINRADMREVFLSLTPSGRAVYEELAPGAIAFATKLENTIDPADMPAFERAVKGLIAGARSLLAETEQTVQKPD
jgi:DNA-binding MarR family transcriptional regulator